MKRNCEGTPPRCAALSLIPGPAPAPSGPRRRDEPSSYSYRRHGSRRRVELPGLVDQEGRPPLDAGEATAKEAMRPEHQRVADLSTLLSLSYSRGREDDRPATENENALGPKGALWNGTGGCSRQAARHPLGLRGLRNFKERVTPGRQG